MPAMQSGAGPILLYVTTIRTIAISLDLRLVDMLAGLRGVTIASKRIVRRTAQS